MDICTAARETRLHIEVPRLGTWPARGPLSYNHVRGMLMRIQTGEITGEKAHRWLGWAQCAAVVAGAGTLEEMKAINHAA